MRAILRPIALGMAAYTVSVVGLWFVLSYVLLLMPTAIGEMMVAITLVPLFLSGYVGARFTVSRHRTRRIVLGSVAALIGYGFYLVAVQARGEAWLFVLLFSGAAAVSALGALLGTARTAGRDDRS